MPAALPLPCRPKAFSSAVPRVGRGQHDPSPADKGSGQTPGGGPGPGGGPVLPPSIGGRAEPPARSRRRPNSSTWRPGRARPRRGPRPGGVCALRGTPFGWEAPPGAVLQGRGELAGDSRASCGALAHPCPAPGMALPRGHRGTGTQGEQHPCTWVCKAPEQLKPGPEQPVAALTWGRHSLGDSQGCPQTPHHGLSAPWPWGQLCSQAGGDTAPRADHSTHTCSCWPQGSPGDAVSTKGAVSRG